jgi:beta-lactamase regulating signal transducer with metallopeptidase domain
MMLDLWLVALLDSLLKGLALCLAAGAAALLLRRASAAARHLVWRLAFAGLLALPLLAALLPQWRVPFPQIQTPAPLPAQESAVPVRSDLTPGVEAGPAPVREETSPSPTIFEKSRERGWNLSWREAVFGIWLAGALALLGALGLALIRVRWQEQRSRPVTDEAWTALLAQVRAELGIRRPVSLVVGDDRAMPMTWGWRRPVVLLPAGSAAWPEGRRRAVLLHELAHIARGDFPTQLAAEIVRALYWLNPLVWMAARKLRMESEHACDDQVLAAGAQASDYAGDLLDIARSLRAVRAAAPAGLAMARPSQLTGRLLAVLDAHRDRRGISRRLALPAWLAAACVVLPLAAVAPAAEKVVQASTQEPAATASATTSSAPQAATTVAQARSAPPHPPAPPNPPKPSGHSTSVSFSEHNDSVNISWSQDGHRIKIRTEGKIELNEDWTDIVRLSHGAEARFEEEKDGVTRRLDVEPGNDGRPVYTWKVDGKQRPFDAEGRRWLQGMLLQLVRGTGYAADERVAAILRKQGPEGVLAEISQIPSDYVKKIYFEKLLAHRDLGGAVVERALRQAGQEVKSDYELANVLLAAAQSQPLSDTAVTVYAEASRSIQSDYEQRRALAGLLKGRRLTSANLAALLGAARQLESDYECAELLAAVAGQNRLDDPVVWRAFAAAADTIQSDYEHHKALSAAVKSGLSPEAVTGVIQASRAIKSDYEHASLLVEIAGKYNLSGGAREAYLEAARSIHSQYERERAEAAVGGRAGR